MEAVQDVESTPEYQALIVAAAGKPERAMGDSIIPAEPPAWSDVRKKAKDLLKDPPHLEVLVHLTRAETHINSFAGLHANLVLIREKLTEFWDSVQPLADEDDEDDPHYQRINLLHELSDDPVFIEAIHRIPLVEVRGLGSFSTRDIAISRGQVSGNEEEVARCQEGLIRGAFQESDLADVQATAEALAAIPLECSALEHLFAERAGTYNQLSLSKLSAKVLEGSEALYESAGDLLAPLDDTDEAQDAGDSGASQTSKISSGSLKDRQSVCAAFDRIIEYYGRNEPSSPVPVLAVRAREMVPKSFFQVLQELAPLSKENFGAMVEVIKGDPLAYLINDSYRMFMSGELLVESASEPPEQTDEPESVSAPVPETIPESVLDPIPDSVVEPIAETGSQTVDGQPVDGPDSAPESAQSVDTSAVADIGPEDRTDAIEQPKPGEAAVETAHELPAAEPQMAQQAVTSNPLEVISQATNLTVSQKASGEQVLVSVDSRSEVLDVLGNVDMYFAANEPSSPVPLIVAEIRKLVSKNFAELLDEFSKALNATDASNASE